MKFLYLAGLATASMIVSAPVRAQECGNVIIAAMSWQSADVLANLDAFVLKNGYGCNSSVIAGDTVPTITSMVEKQQPDIAPEATITLLPEVAARGVKEGRVTSVSNPIPEGNVEGWYIPKYLADKHPEIKTVADALKQPKLFPAPENPSKGGVLMGPQGWGGTVVTAQLFKAFKADQAGFVLVDTGSAAGLDGAISRAYERNRGFLAYYWTPTYLMGKYPMVRLEGGVARDEAEWTRCTTVSSCPDPKPNYWTPSPTDTLVTERLSKRPGFAPALQYLKNRNWSTETVGQVMVWMTDNQATGTDGARHFLRTREDIWTKWVPEDVAKKIKATL